MVNIDKLTYREILKTPVNEFDLKLCPEHKYVLKHLNKRLKELHIPWTPHTWFSEDWFSPDGVGGFAIPLSLGHHKLISLEKRHLGFCEGNSVRSFYKLACHEVGHALDNAFKLRLNKRRQQLFGKSSKSYPISYRPNPNKLNYIHFLGDYYAQSHPDEDWAETVGYILYKKNWHTSHLLPKVRQKLLLANEILVSLENKKAKQSSHLTPFNISNDNRSYEQYLFDKKQKLKLNKKTIFYKSAPLFFTKNPSHLSVCSIISRKRKDIIATISNKTGKDFWSINKCLMDLKKECKENNYHLKHNVKQELYTSKRIEQIIISHLDEFITKNHTRIYM